MGPHLLQCEEQLLLTTGLDSKYPTGTPCVVCRFERVPLGDVRKHTLDAFRVFMADVRSRNLIWSPCTTPSGSPVELFPTPPTLNTS